MERRLYTVKQLVELLSLSRTTVKTLIDNGDLEKVQVGRAVRVPAESVDAYIERLREASKTPLAKAS